MLAKLLIVLLELEFLTCWEIFFVYCVDIVSASTFCRFSYLICSFTFCHKWKLLIFRFRECWDYIDIFELSSFSRFFLLFLLFSLISKHYFRISQVIVSRYYAYALCLCTIFMFIDEVLLTLKAGTG